MTFYTVQCAFRTYESKTVSVEAETIGEALVEAIEAANRSDGWEPVESSCPTFIEAIARGEDVDLWGDEITQLSIPKEYKEDQGISPESNHTLSAALIAVSAVLRDLDAGYLRSELHVSVDELKIGVIDALTSAGIVFDAAELFPEKT